MSWMPELREQHKSLARMAGSWTAEEKLYPSPFDPEGGTAKGKIEAQLALDGFFVVSDYVEEKDGHVKYRGHGVYGWDAAENCYTMHWFDSMGGGSSTPAKGTWQGKTLTFRQTSSMGHSKYVYDFDADDRYRFRIEMSQDGENWAPFMEATFMKKDKRG